MAQLVGDYSGCLSLSMKQLGVLLLPPWMGYQSITRLSPSILSGFPENYLVPSYTPLTFDLYAIWLCIFSIKIASIPPTKVCKKIIINCINGYIARAHVKFLFRLVDDSRSKKCLKDLNEELLCCICRELMVLAHTLPCSHTFCFGCIRDWLW